MKKVCARGENGACGKVLKKSVKRACQSMLKMLMREC